MPDTVCKLQGWYNEITSSTRSWPITEKSRHLLLQQIHQLYGKAYHSSWYVLRSTPSGTRK